MAETLGQFVKEGLAFVERLHTEAFVAPVEADVVAAHEEGLHAVAGNALRAEIAFRRSRPSP